MFKTFDPKKIEFKNKESLCVLHISSLQQMANACKFIAHYRAAKFGNISQIELPAINVIILCRMHAYFSH
jgi:hypothetical protein